MSRTTPTALVRFDQKWYNTEILTPMRDTLLQTKIVRTAAGIIAPIHSEDANIYFPTGASEKIRRAIWRCCKTWFPEQLPAQSEVEAWNEIIWQECNKLNFDQVAVFVEEADTIEKLRSEISEGKDVHEWLNEFYAALKLSETDFLAVVDKRRIFPKPDDQITQRVR